MNADGSGRRRGSPTTRLPTTTPAWSPDGQQIAFASIRDGNDEIYVMNADGTGADRAAPNNAAFDFEPAWSPDGQQIAFTSNRDGNYEIYVMNADGTGQTRLHEQRRPTTSSRRGRPTGSRSPSRAPRDGNARDLRDERRRHRRRRGSRTTPARRHAGVVAGRPADRVRRAPRRQLRDLRDERGRHRAAQAHEQHGLRPEPRLAAEAGRVACAGGESGGADVGELDRARHRQGDRGARVRADLRPGSRTRRSPESYTARAAGRRCRGAR